MCTHACFSGVSHGVVSASELPFPRSPHVRSLHGETRECPGRRVSAAGLPEHTAFTRSVSSGGLFCVFFLRQDNSSSSSSFHLLLKVLTELTTGSSGLVLLPPFRRVVKRGSLQLPRSLGVRGVCRADLQAVSLCCTCFWGRRPEICSRAPSPGHELPCSGAPGVNSCSPDCS